MKMPRENHTSLAAEARAIMSALDKRRLYAECPHCKETILLKDAGLFYSDDFSSEARELYQERLFELQERRRELLETRQQIISTSEIGAGRVNIGLILERVVPSMKGFPFDHNDCRSLFDPIDYLVFDGLSNKGRVAEVVFVEIKTGNAKLTVRQQEIRSLVERKHVEWDTYRSGETK
jgi:predicted Holliday junction resolvase-like endonuclease